MRIVVQRVTFASVSVDNQLISEINNGLLVLLGIESDDGVEDINWLTQKLLNLRIFSDDNLKMNHSVLDCSGEILVVSQFTLFASTKKGNRPSFVRSATPDVAMVLYEQFLRTIELKTGCAPKAGVFGADMKVVIHNDGPVTIIIDSKNKE